ncbi:MAG: peptidylprolyl isomerase [Myxococcales bacterium]|nr:peptidylprolyl isomerase [Myxococcales bacterium]
MRLTAALLSLFLVFSCTGAEEATAPEPKPEQPAPPPKPVPPAAPTGDVWTLPEGHNPALLDPSKATETAPATFKAKFETTRGDFVVKVHRDWAPNGADRFYNLVKIGFYEKAGFFRTIDGFMAQFGISAYPAVSAKWRDARIEDDPVKESNTRGKVTFATGGPNTRTTQLFVNYSDRNARLDKSGFSPFGEVVEGMEVVDSLHKTGEGSPQGPGPNQGKMQARGGAYLQAQFPDADMIEKVTIID